MAEHGAVIALISYGMLRLAPDDLQDRFDRFYTHEIGPYWPAERKLVDSGYADIAFPFAEMSYPGMMIDRIWELGGFLGYLSTWSAVRRVNEAGRDDILKCFVQDISALCAIPRVSCRSPGRSTCDWADYEPARHAAAALCRPAPCGAPRRRTAPFVPQIDDSWRGCRDMPPVLATAIMIAFIEETCLRGPSPLS